jgi:hypothetical protein
MRVTRLACFLIKASALVMYGALCVLRDAWEAR